MKFVALTVLIAFAIGVPAVSGSFNSSQQSEIIGIVQGAAANGTSFWNQDQRDYVGELGNQTADNSDLLDNMTGTETLPGSQDQVQNVPPVVDQPANPTLTVKSKKASFSGDNLRGLTGFSGGVNLEVEEISMTNATGASFVNSSTSVDGVANVGGSIPSKDTTSVSEEKPAIGGSGYPVVAPNFQPQAPQGFYTNPTMEIPDANRPGIHYQVSPRGIEGRSMEVRLG